MKRRVMGKFPIEMSTVIGVYDLYNNTMSCAPFSYILYDLNFPGQNYANFRIGSNFRVLETAYNIMSKEKVYLCKFANPNLSYSDIYTENNIVVQKDMNIPGVRFIMISYFHAVKDGEKGNILYLIGDYKIL